VWVLFSEITVHIPKKSSTSRERWVTYVCTFLCFHQTRTVWCYCSDKVYLYQLMVESVIFYALREWSTLVNEMLLMMAGDVESNPGPGEYPCQYCAINLP